MKDRYTWGMANYKGVLSGNFTYNDNVIDFSIKTTPSKFILNGLNWEYPIKTENKNLKFCICGMYENYDTTTNTYRYPLTLKYQIISTKVCWVKVYAKDTIKGHGYVLQDEIKIN